MRKSKTFWGCDVMARADALTLGADVTAPCKGCGRRVIGCHADCESYAVYRAYLQEKTASDSARDYIPMTDAGHKRIRRMI